MEKIYKQCYKNSDKERYEYLSLEAMRMDIYTSPTVWYIDELEIIEYDLVPVRKLTIEEFKQLPERT